MATNSSLASMWASDFGRNYPATYSYYSGSQIILYLGDILIDEAVFISFDLQQHKLPLYGYASQYFQAVANGVVLVRGQLGINFVDNKYLSVLVYDTLVKQKQQSGQSGASLPTKVSNSLDYMSKLADLQAANSMANMTNSAFRTAINKQKTTYWNNDSPASNAVPRPDQFGGVDIFLTYGMPGSSTNNSTTKKFESVHFTGETQTIEINGQPVIEAYSFLCRSIQNITT
jgi:hypothetical protein